MKKLVLILSFFSCFYLTFAQSSFSSVYSKPRRLYVRSTGYFDFIYPAESRPTVDLIIDKVDASYERLAEYLNVEKKLRFPVTVSPDTDVLNAYFMPMPYNRIVLFDAVSDAKDDVHASTLLNVFEHELTHALSLTIKSSAWKVASYIVGDVASPTSIWSLPSLFVEGVAVFTESMDGKHGRLNDEMAMQLLIQAKMENRFPTWQEVSGARDIYPTGNTSYIFGGAFSAFIQQKYGLDKFREFWHECGRPQLFRVTAGIYKKVYGVKLSDDWQEFADSIKVPHSEEVENYFVLRKGLITTLDARGNSFVWNDTRSKKVYLSKWDGKKIRTDDLFNSDGLLNRLSLSSGGRYLASFGAVAGRGNFEYKRRMYLYDIKKQRFLSKKFPDVLDGAIFHEKGDDIHLLQIFAENQRFTLRRTTYNVKTKKENILWERPFGEDERIFTPVFISQDEIAFIHRDAQGDSIIIQNGTESRRLKIKSNYGDGFRIRYLLPSNYSTSEERYLNFSCNTTGQTGDGYVVFGDDNQAKVYYQADAPILGVERCFSFTNEMVVYISRGFYDDEIRIAAKKNFFYDLGQGVFETQTLNLITDFSPSALLSRENAAKGADGTAAKGADGTAAKGADGTATKGADGTATKGADETFAKGADETFTKGADGTAIKGADETFAKGADETFAKGADETFTKGADETFTKGADETFTKGADGTATKGADETFAKGADETFAKGADETFAKGADETATKNTDGEKEILPTNFDSSEKRYNPFKYSWRGFFLPLLAIPGVSATQSTLFNLRPGLTYMTTTPTEASQFLFNVGYLFSDQPGSLKDAISTGISYVSTHTPVTMTLDLQMDNHFTGQNILSASYHINYTHSFRNYYEALVVENLLSFQTDFDDFVMGDSLQVYFTNYRQTRIGVFDILGIQAGATAQCAFPLENLKLSDLKFQLGGFFNFALPGLLIFENPRNFTANLPLQTDIRMYFNEKFVTFMVIAPKLVLFSAEIQRALPFFPLYFNRVTLDARYYVQLAFPNLFVAQEAFKDFADVHRVRLSLYTTVTPIIGALTNTHFDIGIQLEYHITDNKFSVAFLGGFDL